MHKENSLKISESRQSFGLTSRGRTAFTLPEMLVSVGLMLLVMSLFAEIFSLAVTAMTTQIGLAKNDQRARTAFIVIDNDLKRMSYRPIDGHQGIVPLVPGLRYNEEDAAPQQQGYIYYSENNPLDDTDDVLQFTIFGQQQNNRYPEQNLDYFGRANLLSPSGARDQPDWDDGTPGDGVSVSKQAEVVYFLRHGTLYRRTLLLRDATSIPNELVAIDNTDEQKLAQPATFVKVTEAGETYDLPDDLMTNYGGNFYSNFDYSAHYGTSPYDSDLQNFLALPSNPSLPASISPPTNKVSLFHSSLSNTATNNWPLGVPHFRFGHHPLNGRPREFITTDGTDHYFLGRYTHDETSSPSFRYPQSNAYNVYGRPFSVAEKNKFLNTGQLKATFPDPPLPLVSRRGTDVLMNNVQSFDVEIWDGSASRFVDIGDSGGDFSSANNLNASYGPTNGPSLAPNRNVFDTWHSLVETASSPQLSTLNASVVGTGQPPYVPKINVSTQSNWRGAWSASTTYLENELVIPTAAFITANPQHARINQAVVYKCVTSPSGISAATEPAWPADTVAGQIPDGTVNWEPVDNRKPIKALRIIIRFHDPNSGQMRQMTMVHSFNEDLE